MRRLSSRDGAYLRPGDRLTFDPAAAAPWEYNRIEVLRRRIRDGETYSVEGVSLPHSMGLPHRWIVEIKGLLVPCEYFVMDEGLEKELDSRKSAKSA